MKIYRTQEGAETWKNVSGVPVCQSIDVKYLVVDTTDKETAFMAVWDEAPNEVSGCFKKEIRVDGYETDRSLSITVIYSPLDSNSSSSDNEEEAEAVMNFECSTGSMHITNAISQRIAFGKQDASGLIGWHGAKAPNEVDGVDIITGTMRETYTKVMKVSDLNNSYRRKIQELTGSVNSTAFKGWKPGEVLFLGASYSATESDKKVAVTFQFSIQPNEASHMIGDIAVSKKGFEYVTAITDNQVQDGTPKVVIDTIHINQVYKYKSFDGLGL